MCSPAAVAAQVADLGPALAGRGGGGGLVVRGGAVAAGAWWSVVAMRWSPIAAPDLVVAELVALDLDALAALVTIEHVASPSSTSMRAGHLAAQAAKRVPTRRVR